MRLNYHFLKKIKKSAYGYQLQTVWKKEISFGSFRLVLGFYVGCYYFMCTYLLKNSQEYQFMSTSNVNGKEI